MTSSEVGRRALIQHATVAGLLAVPPLAALSACATSGGGGTQQVAEGRKSAKNPLAVNESAGLDVVIFDGGFGDEYAKAAQAEYVKAYPETEGKIKHAATQKIQAKLAPRFNGGTPP
ncbi:carbohydrate ABC transporter, N-acetylglucosamine/diacetylchitobiose-binding protein, partial [Streptomyces sp. NPDC057676]